MPGMREPQGTRGIKYTIRMTQYHTRHSHTRARCHTRTLTHSEARTHTSTNLPTWFDSLLRLLPPQCMEAVVLIFCVALGYTLRQVGFLSP